MPLDPPMPPFQRLHMDFVGPMPKIGQHNMILTVIDAYTKLAMAIPCMDTITAKDTVTLFINNVVPVMGWPTQLITDKGPQFDSLYTQAFCSAMGVLSKQSTAYHPQSNGAIEWMHRELGRLLRSCTNTLPKKNWVEALGYAMWCYNTLGTSPYELAYG